MNIGQNASTLEALSKLVSGVAELRHVTRVKALPNSSAVELERPLPFQLLPEWSPAVLVWNPATQEVGCPDNVLGVPLGLMDGWARGEGWDQRVGPWTSGSSKLQTAGC